jgi:hypothetical protein
MASSNWHYVDEMIPWEYFDGHWIFWNQRWVMMVKNNSGKILVY